MRNVILPADSHARRTAGLAVAVGLVVLLGSSAGFRTSEPADTADRPNGVDVRQAWVEWDRLFNARQASQLAALYAQDAVSMPFNRPNLVGRQALLADFEQVFADHAQVRHETLVDEVLVTAQWAIERARYTLVLTPKGGGPDVNETGRHVMCRRLVDGRWQIVWEIFNTDQPGT